MTEIQLIMLLFNLGASMASKITAGTQAGKIIDIIAEVEQLGAAAYTYITAQTGQPIDFSQIPLEDPLAVASAPAFVAKASTVLEIPAKQTEPASGAATANAASAAPAAEPAAAAVTDSRCPNCGAAGTQTGATCVACGKVH